MKETEYGWRTDYRDHHGIRIRDEYQTRSQAAAHQAIGKRVKNISRTASKLFRNRQKPEQLRCAQRNGKKRCRRIAITAHAENGKPTCQRHEAKDHRLIQELRNRAAGNEAIQRGYTSEPRERGY